MLVAPVKYEYECCFMKDATGRLVLRLIYEEINGIHIDEDAIRYCKNIHLGYAEYAKPLLSEQEDLELEKLVPKEYGEQYCHGHRKKLGLLPVTVLSITGKQENRMRLFWCGIAMADYAQGNANEKTKVRDMMKELCGRKAVDTWIAFVENFCDLSGFSALNYR